MTALRSAAELMVSRLCGAQGTSPEYLGVYERSAETGRMPRFSVLGELADQDRHGGYQRRYRGDDSRQVFEDQFQDLDRVLFHGAFSFPRGVVNRAPLLSHRH